MSSSGPGRTPLARLLAVAYRSLITDLHAELRLRGWTDVRPAYGFVLLALRPGPLTSGALSDLLGMTKQATSKLVEGMAGGGYLEQTIGTDDARQKPLVLTARGADLLTDVEQVYDDLEARWAALIGEEEVERLRDSLTRALTNDGRHELPAIRPAW